MIRPWLEGNRNGFDVRKLAHIARLKARIGWQNLRTEEFVDEGPFCVTGTDFNNGEVNWNTSYHVSLERYEIDKNIQLQEDDLLITKDGTIGKVAVVRDMPGLATLNSGVFLLRSIGEGVHSPYMKWVIQSKVFDDFVTYNSTGSTINHLYQNVFEQFRFPYPVAEIQKAIADFLDRETARIDHLIEKKQRLVELLRELTKQRIAGILEGCGDSIAPQSLRWLVRVRSGDFISNDEMEKIPTPGRTVPVVGGNGIMAYSDKSNSPSHTIVVGRVGALCGNVHYVYTPSWITDNALILKIISQDLETEFLVALLRAANLNEKASKSAQPLITGETVKSLKVRLPSRSIQAEVCRQISCAERDDGKLSEVVKQSADRLREFRSALITAAVTGQIDVTTWGKQGQTDRRLDQIEEAMRE